MFNIIALLTHACLTQRQQMATQNDIFFTHLIRLDSLEDPGHVRPAEMDVHVLAGQVRHRQHEQRLGDHVHGVAAPAQACEIDVHEHDMSAERALRLHELVHIAQIEEQLAAVADHPHHAQLLQVRVRSRRGVQREVLDRLDRAITVNRIIQTDRQSVCA